MQMKCVCRYLFLLFRVRLQLVDDGVHMLHVACVQLALRLELARDVLNNCVQAGLVISRCAGQGADGLLPHVQAGVFGGELDELGDGADDK